MFNWIKPKASSSDAAPQQSFLKDAGALSKKDRLIQEAMGHAKVAREAIGEETLAKVRELMQKQQEKQMLAKQDPNRKAKEALKSLAPHVHADTTSPMEQAKKILLSMDSAKLADHLRMLREEDKKH